MTTMAVCCPSTGGHEDAVKSWQDYSERIHQIVIDDTCVGEQAGFIHKLQLFYNMQAQDIIGYLHSDLFIHEQDWDKRVLAEFEDPTIGIVGFVGATQLGRDSIYRVPYDFRQLARGDVWSNLIDAEAHGGRDDGTRDVAVVDSCAVFVRRSLLDRTGGWPIARYPNTSHCSDLWICLMAARYGYRCRMVGVSCTHRSGGKGEAGSKWLDERGGDNNFHQGSHVLIYNDFRDVLPLRV